MQITNNLQNQNFGALRFDKSKLGEQAQRSVSSYISELANTRHWDLAIDKDNFGNTLYEYINKHTPENVYCDGISSAKIKDNCISGLSLWVRNMANGCKEYYESFIDLIFGTVEQAQNALRIIESYKKESLKSEADIVKVLDSASEIVLDDTTHLNQGITK